MTHFIRVRRKSVFSAKSDRNAHPQKKRQNFFGGSFPRKAEVQKRAKLSWVKRSAPRSDQIADYTLIIPTGFSLIIRASIADDFRQLSVNVTANTDSRHCVTLNYPPPYRFPAPFTDVRNRDLHAILYAEILLVRGVAREIMIDVPAPLYPHRSSWFRVKRSASLKRYIPPIEVALSENLSREPVRVACRGLIDVPWGPFPMGVEDEGSVCQKYIPFVDSSGVIALELHGPLPVGIRYRYSANIS